MVRNLKLNEMTRADSAGEFHLLEIGFEVRMVNGLRKGVCHPGSGDNEGGLWHCRSWRGGVGCHELEFFDAGRYWGTTGLCDGRCDEFTVSLGAKKAGIQFPKVSFSVCYENTDGEVKQPL